MTDGRQLTTYFSRLETTAGFLEEHFGAAPRMACLLGSGLGDFVDQIDDRTAIDYGQIPEFPQSKVVGHAGRLSLVVAGGRFVALQGRVHSYEGLPLTEVVFGVRALALWGVSTFVVTNAAGGINSTYSPGELVLIRDHINLLGDNPLAGDNVDQLGERFPDMTCCYDAKLRQLARRSAAALGRTLSEGVYAAVMGPSYETPAEIEMLRAMGADLVGMSTVPEVIALRHMKRRVLGISVVTNMAAGMVDEVMDHQDVLAVTTRIRDGFGKLMLELVGELSDDDR